MRIGVIGNIGAGKSTMCDEIAKTFPNYKVAKEAVKENPFLQDFYAGKDVEIQLQTWVLNKMLADARNVGYDEDVLFDRIPYECQIFAANLHRLGKISGANWDTYKTMWGEIIYPELQRHKALDLIIYIKGSSEHLLKKIKERSRGMEVNIEKEYLDGLNFHYEQKVKELIKSGYDVLIINSEDEFDIKYKAIINYIERKSASKYLMI